MAKKRKTSEEKIDWGCLCMGYLLPILFFIGVIVFAVFGENCSPK